MSAISDMHIFIILRIAGYLYC